jgi:heterodisulfide reductase subunit C
MARAKFQELDAKVRKVRCANCEHCSIQCPFGVEVATLLGRAQDLLA